MSSTMKRVRVGELAATQYGLSHSLNNNARGYKTFRMGEIQGGEAVDTGAMKYADLAASEFKKLRLVPGDLLFNRTNSYELVGKTGLFNLPGDYTFASYLVRLSVRRDLVLPKYLNYLMNSNGFQQRIKTKASRSINQANINASILANEEVVIHASLEEQHRILSMLDKAFAAIAHLKENAEKNLQNAKELFEGELSRVFLSNIGGWEAAPLKELGTITSSKRIYKSEYVGSGVPFYRTKEIKQLANERALTTELFIARNRYEQIKEAYGIPKRGDLLLTAIGTIGEIYVVDDETEFYFKDGNVLWLKDFVSVDSLYLKYALRSFVEGLNKMAHGSAYSALPIQRLNEYEVPIPSSKTQSEIANRLKLLEQRGAALEESYTTKLIKIDDLKKALLHKAFSGEL